MLEEDAMFQRADIYIDLPSDDLETDEDSENEDEGRLGGCREPIGALVEIICFCSRGEKLWQAKNW